MLATTALPTWDMCDDSLAVRFAASCAQSVLEHMEQGSHCAPKRNRFAIQVDSEGRKFGKSEGGAIWLSASKLSPYLFYQHLFKTTDVDVVRFLRMLTFLPLDEIAELERSMGESDYRPNTAQRKLAEEVTRFVHGEAGVEVQIRT